MKTQTLGTAMLGVIALLLTGCGTMRSPAYLSSPLGMGGDDGAAETTGRMPAWRGWYRSCS